MPPTTIWETEKLIQKKLPQLQVEIDAFRLIIVARLFVVYLYYLIKHVPIHKTL